MGNACLDKACVGQACVGQACVRQACVRRTRQSELCSVALVRCGRQIASAARDRLGGAVDAPLTATRNIFNGTRMQFDGTRWFAAMIAGTVVMTTPGFAAAQTDEIQVYQGGLAAPGVLNLTLHTNYTPNGSKVAGFPGAVVSNHSLNGVPEFAYGVTKWFEAGLYLPLYSVDQKAGLGIDGLKLRALFAVPNADDRKFFYGANFELSFNQPRWDTKRITSEVRPIIGWHFKPVDFIFNPIFDTSFDGLKNLEFVPSARLAYNIDSQWALAVEEYADFGPVHQFRSTANQAHQIYGVIDRSGKTWDIELGAGVGLTNASDKFTLKLIIARDLYKRH